MLSISFFTAMAILAMASLAFGQSCQDLHGVGTDGCAPSPFVTQLVTVTGVVYSEIGVYNSSSLYLQCPGGSGGIVVYDYNLGGIYSEGDEVSITGTVSDYSGEIEIVSTTANSLLSAGNPVVPTLIGTANLAAGTDLLGDFMEVTGTLALVSSGFNSTYTVDDGSGPVTVFVDGTTGIDTTSRMDNFVGDIVTIRGATKCYNGEGELLPRRDADVILTAVPTANLSWGSMKAQY
jgi:hypothetical protein